MAENKTEEQLLRHLRTQYTFLRSSGKAYDDGVAKEHVRLATAVRILVHDTYASTSLFMHLGWKDRPFLDTAGHHHAGNMLAWYGLVPTPPTAAYLDESPRGTLQWSDFRTW